MAGSNIVIKEKAMRGGRRRGIAHSDGRRTKIHGFGNSVYEVSVLALEFEQEGLELVERAAFNSGCRFRGKPRRETNFRSRFARALRLLEAVLNYRMTGKNIGPE
jgi:hypothetical protein